MEITIEKIIIKAFENSKHAVVERKNMIAIVKTDYKSMAHDIAQEIVKLYETN